MHSRCQALKLLDNSIGWTNLFLLIVRKFLNWRDNFALIVFWAICREPQAAVLLRHLSATRAQSYPQLLWVNSGQGKPLQQPGFAARL